MQTAKQPYFVTVHSYLVPATIHAHKINKLILARVKLVIFMQNLHENTSRDITCEQQPYFTKNTKYIKVVIAFIRYIV